MKGSIPNDISRLINLIRNNEIVLWAGSGFSKYAGNPNGKELSQIIIDHAESEEHKKMLEPLQNSLMDIANEFELLYSREKLLNIIDEIFSSSPKAILKPHQQLLKIPQITTIITTNYDRLFETVYNDNINVFVGSTFQKENYGKINLYKIHGDINNKDDIILTSKDYAHFYERLDTLIWSKLKVIFAEKSVLFIGYSLEDKNIEDVFDKILSQININTKEFFIVMPELQQHKLKHFNTICKTTFIPMKGEDFVNIIEENIRLSIVQDAIEKKINVDNANSICHENGIDITFKHIPNGISTKIELNDYCINPIGQTIMKGFHLKSNNTNKEDIDRFLADCDCKEITIPMEDAELFNNIKGINLPYKPSLHNKTSDIFKLEKQDNKYETEIVDNDGNILIEYALLIIEWGERKRRTTIITKSINTKIEFDNDIVNINIEFIYPHYSKDAVKEMNAYKQWLQNKDLYFRNQVGNFTNTIYTLKGLRDIENNNSILNFFETHQTLYVQIQLIEKDNSEQYAIDHELSEVDINNIRKAAASIIPQRIKFTGYIKLKMDINTSNISQYKQLGEMKYQENSVTEDDFIDLFGKCFLLGRRKITIINSIISNIIEVEIGLLKGNIIPLIIKSETDEAILEYVWDEKDKLEYAMKIKQLELIAEKHL